MHVSIIVPAGNSILSSIVGPYKLFSAVNGFLMQSGQREEPYYEIDLVGIAEETQLYNNAFSIKPTKQIKEVTQTDLIIVTTLFGDLPAELERNSSFIPWIRQMYLQNGAQVGSLCGGAFLLAETGLLEGRRCSTHWSLVDQFRNMFPGVNLVPHQVITEDNGIYSSGGSYSFLNLLLHLVQKFNGKETANWVAKMFEIDIDRSSQNPFIIFQGQKNHEDPIIRNIQSYIEENYDQRFSLDDLAKKFGISKRNLIRRFKKATHNTPNQYLQRVKMEAAKRELEKTNHSITEIMYDSGYNDLKAFRQTFKKIVGIPPSAYRMKYGRVS